MDVYAESVIYWPRYGRSFHPRKRTHILAGIIMGFPTTLSMNLVSSLLLYGIRIALTS